MSRNTWRNVFIGIIVLTIPCYLFGIGVYLWQGGGISATDTPEFITNTPINLTELALTDPSLITTPITMTPSPEPSQGGLQITPLLTNSNTGITPIVPTTSNFEPVPFATTRVVPTRFITQTPSNTPPASNTPLPSNTPVPAQPTATQPVLLPATDTPSP